MRSVSLRLEDIEKVILCLGFVGENEHTRVMFDAKKMYDQYPHAAVSLSVTPPDGESYPAVIERDGDLVIWDVVDSNLTAEGQGEYQLGFSDDPHVARTYVGKFKVKRSIIPTGEIPDPLDDFLTRAGAALTAIPETIDAALEEAKESGEFDGPQGPRGERGPKGDDGYTPVKGVDYFDGERGPAGPSGSQGPQGPKGDPGDDYVLTEEDKEEIANMVDLSELEEDVSELKSAIDSVEESIAPVESSATATSAHAVGELFILNDQLLVALSAIAIGDTITTTGQSPNAAVTTLSAKMIKDVQANGTSILLDGVANIPKASSNTYGLIRDAISHSSAMLFINADGRVVANVATTAEIKSGSLSTRILSPIRQNESVFYGLAKAAGDSTQSSSSNAVGTYTESAKSAISDMLNATETVSGTTPTITALPGIRYVCGEVSTLTIVLPASGIVDVVFQSGSTATVLTVTPTTGVTVKWANNGFDPTSLDANTTYEINIMDGLGVVGSWS